MTYHTTQDIIARTILGTSPEIARLRALIAKVAPTRLPVIIEGPTGAGKELVAQAMHQASGRGGALVAFNVCAIPESMFEDALFGHVRGAFTGATSDAAGYLTEAHGGTAFLDEIGGLPLALQAKLLRAVETQQFRPVGAKGDRRSDFRMVAATNEGLDALVAAGRFRDDLRHRLSAIVLRVPPLRERPDDVPLLAAHFAARLTKDLGRSVSLSDCALRALQRHDWPGNVRELRRFIESAMVLADDERVTAMDVEAMIRPARPADAFADEHGRRQELLELLERFGGSTTRVANHLGIDRTTVYRRMQQLAIPTPKRTSARRDGPWLRQVG